MTDTMNTDAPPELDDITEGLKVWGSLGVELGKSVDEQTRTMERLWRSLQRNTPVYASKVNNLVMPASGTGVIPLGKPDLGTYWEITNVVVGGLELNTVAAGSAGLYVGANPSLAGAGLGNSVDLAATLPSVGFYGTHQLVVHEFEHLFIVLFGATAAQQYVAKASFAVYNSDSAKGTVATEA